MHEPHLGVPNTNGANGGESRATVVRVRIGRLTELKHICHTLMIYSRLSLSATCADADPHAHGSKHVLTKSKIPRLANVTFHRMPCCVMAANNPVEVLHLRGRDIPAERARMHPGNVVSGYCGARHPWISWSDCRSFQRGHHFRDDQEN